MGECLACNFARLALLNSAGESSEQRILTDADMSPSANLAVIVATLVASGLRWHKAGMCPGASSEGLHIPLDIPLISRGICIF